MIGARVGARRGARPRNWPLWGLALVLSVFLWAFVRLTQTPFSSTISQADVDVKLDVRTDEDMDALEAPTTVNVTVRGAEDAVHSMKAGAITASVDLRGHASGLVFPKVNVMPPPDLTVISVSPDRPGIHLETVITQSFPVETKLAGRVAPGYKASAPILRSATVSVKGPSMYVKQVKSVIAIVPLNGTETGLMQSVMLEPRDEDGNLVKNVQVSPDKEIVTVNVTPAVVPRVLPVFPRIVGTPPRDCTVDTSWTPRVVPIVFARGGQGSPTVLNSEPIDLAKLAVGEHKLVVAIPQPDGATLVQEKELQVTIRIRPVKKAAAPAREKKPPTSPKPR